MDSLYTVDELIEEESEIPDAKDAYVLESADGSVSIEHVDFSYSPKQRLIEDFNLKVIPGQRIAIVGPTGAGKTTMVNLLMKFYEINSGDILIDGISIKDLTRENIHELFIMVLQDTWLFNGSIMVFTPALGYFFIIDVIGGGKMMILGNLIKNQFLTARNWPFGAAISVFIILITALLIWLYRKMGGKMDELGGN